LARASAPYRQLPRDNRREAISAIAAKSNLARLRSLQCGFCPLRNHLAFMFGDGR